MPFSILWRPVAHQYTRDQLDADALQYTQTYREDHPAIARGRNNLAIVLQSLGELAAARELFEQALVSDLITYGEDHTVIARDRNNLAGVRQAIAESAGRAEAV